MSRYAFSASRSLRRTALCGIRRPSVLAIQASRFALNSSIRLVVNSMICANFMARTRPSGPSLEHDVVRRFRHPAQCLEPRAGDDLPKPSLASLRTERSADLLGQGAGRAEQGREAVVSGADRVEVADKVVVGEGLDEHERPARREALANV